MVSFRQKGGFSRTTRYLKRSKDEIMLRNLDHYGRMGVAALESATPSESGETANSWYYEIDRQVGQVTIRFLNSHVHKGVNIAIILHYGHGTGTGGWVEGREYINSAIQPVFDQLANEAWKGVVTV